MREIVDLHGDEKGVSRKKCYLSIIEEEGHKYQLITDFDTASMLI